VPSRIQWVSACLILLVCGCAATSSPAIERPAPRSVAPAVASRSPGRLLSGFGPQTAQCSTESRQAAGGTTVVFAHGYPSNLCDWADVAAGLVRRDHGVLLFDFRNLGLSDKGGAHAPGSDLAGAVEEARRHGAERIVLVGGSYGGTAALASGPDLDVAGVVALSPPPDLSNWIDELDAVSAVGRLDAPLLVLYARDDWRTPPAAKHALARAAATDDKTFVEFQGHWHAGALLYRAPFRARARRLLLGFVRARAEGR
jgi:pimeloyl-ACP methyl ester carboxylesterase